MFVLLMIGTLCLCLCLDRDPADQDKELAGGERPPEESSTEGVQLQQGHVSVLEDERNTVVWFYMYVTATSLCLCVWTYLRYQPPYKEMFRLKSGRLQSLR